MSEPILEVKNLRVKRKEVILHEVSWAVQPGENWVILGANGSGKTSLLSALTAYLTPTAGIVRIGKAQFGRADWSEVRKSVGLVSSSLGQQIEPLETAREVVLSGPSAMINFWTRQKPEELTWVEEDLRLIHASHLADRPWMQLSQGERQRVLIGRALAAKPKILFLDEPCAGLDPVAREDFLAFLQQLNESRAVSLVLVTHHIEEITEIFTHVLLIREGRVLASGPKEEVLTTELISQTFGAPVLVRKNEAGRYSLEVGRERKSSFRG